jgi:hypothetical protein
MKPDNHGLSSYISSDYESAALPLSYAGLKVIDTALLAVIITSFPKISNA